MSTLLLLACLFLLPFLTYYATNTLFLRRAASTAPAKLPPSLPYYFPALFHTPGLAQLGAPKYFTSLIKEYAAFAPFRVRAGLRSWVVLRDPTHVRRVLEAEQHFSTKEAEDEVFHKLYASREASPGHLNIDSSTTHQILSDTGVDKFADLLSASMHGKMFQLDTWTRIEHLSSFLRLVLLRCLVDTLFGTELLRLYPGLVRDYLAFAAAVDGFVPGVPRLMMSSASAPRERIYSGVKKWLEADYDSQHDEWDQKMGLRCVRQYYSHDTPQTSAQLRTAAAAVLSIIHTSLSSLVPLTFWTLLETTRSAALTTDLSSTIAQNTSRKPNITALSQHPLLAALTLETHRLRIAKYITLTTRTDGFPLDKHWALQRGDVVLFSTRDIGTNAAWRQQQKQKQPPLSEFNARRFLPHTTANKQTPTDEDVPALISRFASLAHTSFPPPAFLARLHTATLAVLLGAFEWSCDGDEVDAALVGADGEAEAEDEVRVGVRVRVRR